MSKKTFKNKSIFWDYDTKKIDLNKPKTKLWYLKRKLDFGDFSEISEKDLKKHLVRLDIDPSLKELLRNYIKHNA